MQVEQSLDAPAAIGEGDVSRVEIAGGVAGMIEMIDFSDVELAAGVEADAGGGGCPVFFHGGEDGGGTGGKLLAGPILVQSLFLKDAQEEREVVVIGILDPLSILDLLT